MDNRTAIFVGKFQPPHLGHIRSILKISRNYNRLIVGVTQDEKIISSNEVCSILEEVFQDHDNIKVQEIPGVIENGTAILPDEVAVVLSGNQKVLDMLSSSYDTKFIPRTEGIGYSATEIRNNSMSLKALSLSEVNQKISVEIADIDQLRPLEQVLSSHLENIAKMIEEDITIRKPVIIDKRHKIVLDGSHRYAYLLREGYMDIPVIAVDYEDESIFVGNHLKHRFLKDETLKISKAEVIDRALNEKIYPPRTTRHFFPFRKEDYPVTLRKLRKGKKRNIDYLIAGMPIDKEIDINMSYINEIDEVIFIIEQYLQEQRDVKTYLNRQIEMIKNEK